MRGQVELTHRTGSTPYVGLPWSTVGTADLNEDGSSDLLWHNAETNLTLIWLLRNGQFIGKQTVLDESGKPAYVGRPWSIVGVGALKI
jgi:hypothetical protein